MPQHDEDTISRQPHQLQQEQSPAKKILPPSASPARVSKAEALSLVKMLKRGLVVASVLGFGALGGLALSHGIGSATNQASPTQTGGSSTSPSFYAPFEKEQHEEEYERGEEHEEDEEHEYEGSFFQQQGGYNIGTNPPAQSPSSTSRVS